MLLDGLDRKSSIHIPLPRSLTTITLDTSQSNYFHRLMSFRSHTAVRVLILRDFVLPHAQEVGKLLKTLGSSLEHVELRTVSSSR